MPKRCISFKQTEKKLLDHYDSKRSPSNYIKDLIEEDMKKNNKENEKSKKEEYIW